MIEGAKSVFVLYDPDEEFDSMHASLFQGKHVSRHRCRHLGPHLGRAFHDMGIMDLILNAAGRDRLTARLINKLLRQRRTYSPYLARVLSRLQDDGRDLLSRQVCHHAVNRLRNSDHFARLLRDLDRSRHI